MFMTKLWKWLCQTIWVESCRMDHVSDSVYKTTPACHVMRSIWQCSSGVCVCRGMLMWKRGRMSTCLWRVILVATIAWRKHWFGPWIRYGPMIPWYELCACYSLIWVYFTQLAPTESSYRAFCCVCRIHVKRMAWAYLHSVKVLLYI